MILRTPTMGDIRFVVECFQDWPEHPDEGPITSDRVQKWIRRWRTRNDETCLIAETDEPVGLVLYRAKWVVAYIDNLVVHPNYRLRGHSKTIRSLLKEKLVSEGVVVAEFKTLPGPINYPDNRVTWDMEI